MAGKRPTAAQVRVIRDNGPVLIGVRQKPSQSGKRISFQTAQIMYQRGWLVYVGQDKMNNVHVYAVTQAAREALNASH